MKELRPSDIRALPNYTLPEGAHYLRIPVSTLKAWIAQPEPTFLLSFINLVEAHVLHAIRHVHGVKLWKVRSALEYVRQESGQRTHSRLKSSRPTVSTSSSKSSGPSSSRRPEGRSRSAKPSEVI